MTGKNIAITLMLLAIGCQKQSVEKLDTRPLVRVGAVTNGVEFTETIDVQGMLRAKNTASIAARVPGTIDELLVDEGASVNKGQPLFKIDQVNLANAVRAAKDDLEMAKAKLAQTEAMAAKARLDVERMARLVKEGAVTKDMFEKSEVAAKSHAAALNAAKATITKAETGLAVAEKNFADSVVKAPFAGTITKKHKHAGDFCSPGVKIFEIEDTACYEVCLSLNAEQYGRVMPDKTHIEVKNQRTSTLYPLTYKSPSVNPMTRTFEVRAVVKKTDALAAGMLVSCRVIFASRTSPAVPATAVAHRGGGDCVFVVRDGKAVRMPVQAGLSAQGLREILAPTFSPEDRIIIEGMLLVHENDEVRITQK